MHQRTKAPFWPQDPEAKARQGRLGEGEASDWAMRLWFHFEAVPSLCLTLKTPKAKDSRLERTESQGGSPKQFPQRLSAKEETWGHSHFCVCFIGSRTPALRLGRRQREFCPGSLLLGQGGRCIVKKARAHVGAPAPRSQDAP